MINIKEIETKMNKSIENTTRNFATIRSGRASVSMLDGVKVEYYGTLVPVNQVAHITIPEARLIEIKPWDKSVLADIEKAISKSDLGIAPMNDGKVIRLSMPPMNEERRKEIAKVVKKMAEDGKVSVRTIRREANELVDEENKEKQISEDEAKKLKDQIQKLTDKFIANIDQITANKEKEIMEI